MTTFSATKLSYSGWIPYWAKTAGINDTENNLSKLKSINPFSYEIDEYGNPIDKIKIGEEPWVSFLGDIRNKKTTATAGRVKIIPTINSLDGMVIHELIKTAETRKNHIDKIFELISKNNFDGIDIDYENKKADDRANFSAFLKSLSIKLHANKKTLSCTIEARTPLSSRFVKIPKDVRYVNDYVSINKYCDEVKILTYGQGNIDLLLNKKKGNGKAYLPIADNEWVTKVIKESLKNIKASKIQIGFATYGYEYEIKNNAGKISYSKIRNINYNDIVALYQSKGIIPEKNLAGEFSFIYMDTTSNTNKLVWFSNAETLNDKVKLAKKYGLKGVALFKFDGGFDKSFWDILK